MRAELNETGKFEYVNTGGYYHSLPGDPCAHLLYHRGSPASHGFPEREGSPEVAPSQFEINYSYGEVVAAADQSSFTS